MLSMPPDEDFDSGQKWCATCADRKYCANVRYTMRPCEILATEQALQEIMAPAPVETLPAGVLHPTHAERGEAPWLRPRPEEDPMTIHAHMLGCRSRLGLVFHPELCDCGVNSRGHGVHPTPDPALQTTHTACGRIPTLSNWAPCHLPLGHLDEHRHRPLPLAEQDITTRQAHQTAFQEAIREQHRDLVRDLAAREDARLLQEGSDKPELQTFASGAKSSEHLVRYDLIPWHVFADRLAKRYTDGAVKYDEYNWQKGLTERAYVLDRANHTLRHLHRAIEQIRMWTLDGEPLHKADMPKMITDGLIDDDLAAALWGIIFLMAAQRAHGAEL